MNSKISLIIFALLFLFLSVIDSHSFIKIEPVKSGGSDTTYDVVNFYNCSGDTIIYRRIEKDVPAFAIHIKIKSDYQYFPVNGIVLKDSATNKLVQIIEVEKDSLFIINIEFADYNFDGYIDMYLYDGCAILANCFGKIYIYNPSNKEFIHDKVFDEMTSVSINKDKKEIQSFNQCCAGANSIYQIYKYINGKLTIQKEILKDLDNKSKFIYTIKKYDENGNLRDTRKIESEDFDLKIEE